MALDATISGASANSYVLRADAQTYFDDRLDVAEWTDASNANKDSSLVMATLRLDQEEYDGTRADSDQALKWPRYGIYVDDIYQDVDVIPKPIKEATYELGLALLKDNTLLSDTGLEGFENVSLSGLDVTPRFKEAGTLPANVLRLVKDFKISIGNSMRLLHS